jgi:hypothetical protein
MVAATGVLANTPVDVTLLFSPRENAIAKEPGSRLVCSPFVGPPEMGVRPFTIFRFSM